jgi:hypothetical protein
MKDRTTYRVVERRKVPRGGAILRDEVIELDVNLAAYGIELDSPVQFRRIVAQVPDREEPMVFLTNHLGAVIEMSGSTPPSGRAGERGP